MPLKSIGIFLLLGWLRAAIMEEVHGIVGGDVDLSCISPEEKHFNLDKILVYWQTKHPPLVSLKAYIPGDDTSQYVNAKYQNRTSLSLEKMERGDFTLHLSNITTGDEQEYECHVLDKSNTERLFASTVHLHVAANYSVPKVTEETNNEEVTFTCTSYNGFPKPKVYWVNKTDNSLLNQSLQNDTFTTNEKGLFNVSSVLKIAWTPNISIECCIENVNLQQNLTVQSNGQIDRWTITTTPNSSTPPEKTPNIAFFVTSGIILVILLGVAIWSKRLCTRRHHYGDYTGPEGNRQMAETTDYI
ncbi:ICOS ligand-like isoform X2 [Dromiciops gliroides]|uniref:ICOS ligand-like isoform X2 n=1 Tax=Dromiciops gliroides TaxID=33562 RepID=UPI001CC5C849|nr:ICOS ligand-like isoform X2 [Dromiciops gliroides]